MFTPIISKTLAVSAFTAFLSLSATSVSAINITGVTASTTIPSSINYNIQNTVNGAGLPSDTPSLTGVHAASSGSNAWASAPAGSTGNIDFNLGGSYNLSGFSYWNWDGSPNPSVFGIKDVSILTSTDGLAYTSLAGAPTQFAIGGSGNPEQFTFSPTVASHVRFSVLSTYGPPVIGFNEVQFDSAAATPVPFDFDPSLGVVSLGVVFGINKWRKNKNKDLKK